MGKKMSMVGDGYFLELHILKTAVMHSCMFENFQIMSTACFYRLFRIYMYIYLRGGGGPA